MPPNSLTNFEIQKYCQTEPKFKGIYSWSNPPNTVKDWTYIVNLDKYKSIVTHWIPLYAIGNSVTYFDRFNVEHIPEEIKRYTDNSNIITSIFRVSLT